jgi:hypothetical protein
MNNIIIELCAEDRARLDKLAQAIEAMTTPQAPQILAQSAEPEKEAKHPAEMEPTPFPENTEPQAPASPMPTTEPEPVKEDAPAVTHKDIAKLVIELAGAGKKDKVQDVVYVYAKKVTDIPADKLAEVHQQLTALKGVTE